MGEFTFTDPPLAGHHGNNESPPAVVPRNKWCHVCFVATAKNKLVVYLNGHLVKRVSKDKNGSVLSGGSVTSNDVASSKGTNSKKGDHGDKKSHSDTGIDLKQLQSKVGELRLSELRAKTPGSASRRTKDVGDDSILSKDSAQSNTISLGLPMRDIGEATGPGIDPNISISGPSSYHGSLQEVLKNNAPLLMSPLSISIIFIYIRCFFYDLCCLMF